MSMLRRSTLTLDAAAARVCESAGSDSFSDQLSRAKDSVKAAIRHWNNAANWKWLTLVNDDYTTVQGTDTYSVPVLCKAVHSVRMLGSTPRTLSFIGRRQLNKFAPKQDDKGLPTHYDLFISDSSGQKLRLIPIPSGAESFEVHYYRQMVVPCSVSASACEFVLSSGTMTIPSTTGITVGSSVAATFTDPVGVLVGTVQSIVDATTIIVENVSTTLVTNGLVGTATIGDTFLDIPADYEDGILAWATHHYLGNRQGGNSPKTQYWAQYSAAQLDQALRNNMSDTPDQEIMFYPGFYADSVNLGPNDIRWADMPW